MVKRKPSSVLASPTGGGWAGGGAQVGGGKDGGINKETPHILGPRSGVNKYQNPSHLCRDGRMNRAVDAGRINIKTPHICTARGMRGVCKAREGWISINIQTPHICMEEGGFVFVSEPIGELG